MQDRKDVQCKGPALAFCGYDNGKYPRGEEGNLGKTARVTETRFQRDSFHHAGASCHHSTILFRVLPLHECLPNIEALSNRIDAVYKTMIAGVILAAQRLLDRAKEL